MGVGLATGLGAATADAIYGGVAGFGLTSISSFLVGSRFWLGLIGGIFLCWLGIRTYRSKPAEKEASNAARSRLGAFGSTLLLTLTNPTTILSFVAAFAGLGLAQENPSFSNASIMVAGVFLGSAAWWIILSGGLQMVHRRLAANWMTWINRVSGGLIFGFGLAAFASLQK
jgi:threonine/homoserine/homoserine lactone efflux protein